MYNYLNYFSKLNNITEISIKNKSFSKDISKRFNLKSVYTTKGENNIEKTYDDLVFNNKKIDDVLYKKVNNELSDSSKNIFQEAKKLVLEEENLKFEKSIGETVKLKNQKDNLSETPKQKEPNDFLEQIKEEQKTIDMNFFEEYFSFSVPSALAKQSYEIINKKENDKLVELMECFRR